MTENALDRMWKTLEKHSAVGPRPETSPSKPPSEPLAWKAPLHRDQQYRESVNGRYRIAKIILGGKPAYEVYRMPPSGDWWFCVAAGRPSFDDAKAVAQRDWDR